MKKKCCVLCGSERLFEFLDLGFHPHSDQFRDNKEEPEMTYPLALVQCEECELVQLSYIVDREEMFTKDYLYESSITNTALEHWNEFADTVLSKVDISEGLVVDIGGNDGTLLERFKERGMQVLNVDPAFEVTPISVRRGIPTITSFWKKGLVKDADIILGTNVFAHISDYNGFMDAVDDSLKDDGVFIFESPYLGEFIKGVEFDTVYHQHVTYLSLKPTVRFLDRVGMEIFDIDFTPLHGGSFRCYIARKGKREIKPIVQASIDAEDFSREVLVEFAEKSQKIRTDLMSFLWKIKSEGKSIAAVSAPAKGMTLLNYCGIKDNLIDFVTERSTLKQGRYTPGSHIRIVSDEELVKRQPDYALILAWNFKEEIIRNNPDYKGTWIVAIPEVAVST
jgi:2-polyprenyl-3-methyl-5-hydroxy-6-metoxy-1,4-benzoquinol methylase